MWNKTIFGNIDQRLKSIEDEIHTLDNLANTRQLEELEIKKLSELQVESRKWRMRKSQLFSQYSRCRNLTQKFHNTKYFDKKFSLNKRKTRFLGFK